MEKINRYDIGNNYLKNFSIMRKKFPLKKQPHQEPKKREYKNYLPTLKIKKFTIEENLKRLKIFIRDQKSQRKILKLFNDIEMQVVNE